MREYLLLVKLQLLSLFGINKARHATDDAERKKAKKNVLLLAVMVIALGNAAVTYTKLLLMALPGSEESALALMAAGISAFLLMISTLSVKGVLFAFGDYDTVMSWPVPRPAVAAARITALYAYNLAYSIMFTLPMAALYAFTVHPKGGYYPMAILLLPLLPMLPTAVGMLLGTAVTTATAKLKKTSLLHTAFQMLLALIVVILSMRMSTSSGELAANAALRAGTVYPPAALFAEALTGSVGAFAAFAALNLLALSLAGLAVTKLFFPLSSRLLSAPDGAIAVRKNERARSALFALYRSEWKRYLSSSVYVTNTCFGELMLLIAAVLAAVKRADILAFLAEVNEPALMGLIPFIMSLLVLMAATTPVSVSMEGKRLWIVKSLPISARDWLLSKVLVSITPAVPAIAVSATVIGAALKVPAGIFPFLYLIPAANALLMAVVGLYINLLLPKLDWTSESEAVKQGLSELVGVFTAMLLAFLPAAACYLVKSDAALPALTAAALVLSVLLFRLLARWGEKKLLRLNVS